MVECSPAIEKMSRPRAARVRFPADAVLFHTDDNDNDDDAGFPLPRSSAVREDERKRKRMRKRKRKKEHLGEENLDQS